VPTGCPVDYAAEFTSRDGFYLGLIAVNPGETYRVSGWVNCSKATSVGGGIGWYGGI
jgi:hypothetical protein